MLHFMLPAETHLTVSKPMVGGYMLSMCQPYRRRQTLHGYIAPHPSYSQILTGWLKGSTVGFGELCFRFATSGKKMTD